MQDHGRPDDRTFRISWAGRSAQKTRRTNVQRKISISAFLLYALKFFHELPTVHQVDDEEAPDAKKASRSFQPAEDTKEILINPSGSEGKTVRIGATLTPK